MHELFSHYILLCHSLRRRPSSLCCPSFAFFQDVPCLGRVALSHCVKPPLFLHSHLSSDLSHELLACAQDHPHCSVTLHLKTYRKPKKPSKNPKSPWSLLLPLDDLQLSSQAGAVSCVALGILWVIQNNIEIIERPVLGGQGSAPESEVLCSQLMRCHLLLKSQLGRIERAGFSCCFCHGHRTLCAHVGCIAQSAV